MHSASTALAADGASNHAVAYVGPAGSGSTIENMTFNGADAGDPNVGNYPFVGLDIFDASATLNGVQIMRIDAPGFSGGQDEYGLPSNDDNNSTQTLTVQNSNINTYEKDGVRLEGSGLTADITGTSVSGVGPTPYLAQNGIEYLFGAAGTASGDTVTGNACNEPNNVCGPDEPAGQAQGTGFLLYQSGPVKVSGSTINNNDNGILYYEYPPYSGTLTVSHNVLRSDRYEGLELGEGTANVTGNAISDSNIGVQVYSYGGPGEDAANAVATLLRNSITDNGTAIEAGDDTTSSPTVFPVITAHHNDISRNSSAGFANDVSEPQNATYNYWGCHAGPGHQGCDGVTGVGASLVKFKPFLASEAPLPPQIRVGFGAALVPLGRTTALKFRIKNPNLGSRLTGVGFSDSLPTTLKVTNPNGLTGYCGGGKIKAMPGSSSVTLSGATLPAGGSCSFSVNVRATTAGRKFDQTGHVSSNEGGNGPGARTSVRVVGAPTVTITVPWENANFHQGARVLANYSCHDARGGLGIASCRGTVHNGKVINTSSTGQHTFTVTAKSREGLSVTKSVHYTVKPGSGH